MAKKKKSDPLFSAFLALFFLIIIDFVFGMGFVYPNPVTTALIALSAIYFAFFTNNSYPSASLIGCIFIIVQSICRFALPWRHYCKLIVILFVLSISVIVITFYKKPLDKKVEKRAKSRLTFVSDNIAVISIILSSMYSFFDMFQIFFMCDYITSGFWKISIFCGIALAICSTVWYTVKGKSKFGWTSVLIFLTFILLFTIIAESLMCCCNLAFSPGEPTLIEAVIVEKDTTHSRKGGTHHWFDLIYNGDKIHISVSSFTYYEHEEGDEFTLYKYTGAFNKPLYCVK